MGKHVAHQGFLRFFSPTQKKHPLRQVDLSVPDEDSFVRGMPGETLKIPSAKKKTPHIEKAKKVEYSLGCPPLPVTVANEGL